MLTGQEMRMYRFRKYLKKIKRCGRTNKRLKKENSQLRQKNGNLVLELQKERMDKNVLFNDLHSLQTENMDHLFITRGTSQCIAREISEIETFLGDIVGNFIQASNALTKMQLSFGNIKTCINQQFPGVQNNQSKNSLIPNLLKRKASSLMAKNMHEDLEVIEEVSHENSISPLVVAKNLPARYSRKCKRGLRNLICQETSSSGRKSTGKTSKRRSSYNEKDMSLEAPTEEDVNTLNNVLEMDSVKDDDSNESNTKMDTSTDQIDSPAVFSEGSNATSTPRRYSDVVRSTGKDNEESFSSPASFSASELGSPESSKLRIPNHSLSFVNVRRGTSNRKFNASEVTTCSRNSLKLSRVSPKPSSPAVVGNQPKTPTVNNNQSARAHHTTASFTFYSLEPDWPRRGLGSERKSRGDSTLKATIHVDDADIKTFTEKPKKKNKKEPKGKENVEYSAKQITPNFYEPSPPARKNPKSASKVHNSTPKIVVSKQKKAKRPPLKDCNNTPNVISSTQIAADDTQVIMSRKTLNASQSISPIKVNHSVSLQNEEQTSYYDNSNDSGSGRPKRKATRTNYKEPTLNVKLRR